MRDNITYNKCKSLDFNIGDRFSEMFNFWVCIIHITNADRKSNNNHKKNFLKDYHMIEGCWVSYHDHFLD